MSIKNPVNNTTLFKNESMSDILFIVQNRKGVSVKFPSHRLLLISHSTVFERMFCGALNTGPVVNISDVCAEAFEDFLKFFYLEEFSLTVENIPQVCKLIDKYDAAEFWPLCEKYLIDTMTEATAYCFYELALSFNLSEEVTNSLHKLINDDLEKSFRIYSRAGMNSPVYKDFLKSDKLLYSEMGILEKMIAKATQTLKHRGEKVTDAKLKKAIGSNLKYVRFPIMEAEQLLLCFEKYPQLLPREQYFDLLQYVTCKRPLSVAKQFNTKHRAGDLYNVGAEKLTANTIFSNYSCSLFLKWNGAQSKSFLIGFTIAPEIKINVSSCTIIAHDIKNDIRHCSTVGICKNKWVNDSNRDCFFTNKPIRFLPKDQLIIMVKTAESIACGYVINSEKNTAGMVILRHSYTGIFLDNIYFLESC